jgi:hypothetical protein
VAIGFAAEVSKTDENKREGEQTVAKRLYKETPLDEATINCALAGLRVCLITIKSIVFQKESWPSIQERCQRDPGIAFRSITKLSSK